MEVLGLVKMICGVIKTNAVGMLYRSIDSGISTRSTFY